ncbi:hypothetical protein ONS95_014818 [Cadophora gregata]|uniref:uncharacterized protein n=1 Tax=Cadophora gregata TaxID=51156 RepID=UPI0026DBA2A9|nr:uncharacterized protein ONS95_014818 [Cadophora gregata]KAK0113114.1 hypothetical protein ONS95_014818 [Cadophora gregata]
MTGKSTSHQSSSASILTMDKRSKSEQFRKRKNNFFRRGYDIGVACDTEVFILFKRNGKFYTFANTEELEWPTKEDIQRNLVLCKTAADYESKSRTKKKASRANATTSCSSNASEDIDTSTLPLLGIKAPVSPRLDSPSHYRVGGWKDFIASLTR